MKKIIFIVLSVLSISSYAVFPASLRYICKRLDPTNNSDIKKIKIYEFSRNKVIIEVDKSLDKASFVRKEGNLIVTYDAGYENDNILIISQTGGPSSLAAGIRTIAMSCGDEFSEPSE